MQGLHCKFNTIMHKPATTNAVSVSFLDVAHLTELRIDLEKMKFLASITSHDKKWHKLQE